MSVFNLETIWLGLHNLRLHKLRSLLTALGIIFGVAAVICMLSISEGASADELRMINQLGTRNIIVTSVRPEQSRQVEQRNSMQLDYGITYADRELIEKTVPHIERIVPLKAVAYTARYGEHQMESRVIGTTPALFQSVSMEVARGRRLTETDLEERKTVCLIGENVRRELFKFEDPLGQELLAVRGTGAVPLTVVGVLESVETAGAPKRGVQERDINSEIYMPYDTAATLFGDTTVRSIAGTIESFRVELSSIYVTVDTLENVLPVSDAVGRVFTYNHDKNDYDIRVPLRSLRLAERKKRNQQLMLGFIAGISLLVGGIGIMNIMLATVTERTREIGIRRALGAKRRHITAQFLVETVVLCMTGGIVGIALGTAGAFIIAHEAGWTETTVRLWAVGTSFSLSVIVGVVFGLWPAVKAARLDPIEALRYQ